MAPGASDESVSPSGKAAKAGKEGKSTKEPRDGKKTKDESTAGVAGEGKNSALLRQMASDLSAVSANLQRLQSDVDMLKGHSEPLPVSGPERHKKSSKGTAGKSAPMGASPALAALLNDQPEVIVALAIRAGSGDDTIAAPFVCAVDHSGLSSVETAQVARLGYAFSSIPKIALIRLLLENGEQTAAQLGEGAGLTTGSLYHHLRELVHAEVAYQSSRNRYALTSSGRRTMLVLLALQTGA